MIPSSLRDNSDYNGSPTGNIIVRRFGLSRTRLGLVTLKKEWWQDASANSGPESETSNRVGVNDM